MSALLVLLGTVGLGLVTGGAAALLEGNRPMGLGAIGAGLLFFLLLSLVVV